MKCGLPHWRTVEQATMERKHWRDPCLALCSTRSADWLMMKKKTGIQGMLLCLLDFINLAGLDFYGRLDIFWMTETNCLINHFIWERRTYTNHFLAYGLPYIKIPVRPAGLQFVKSRNIYKMLHVMSDGEFWAKLFHVVRWLQAN